MNRMRIVPYYNENEELKADSDILYHFTNRESFFAILKDLTLLPSSFENLNDLNEGNIESVKFLKDTIEEIKAERIIKENCKLICFTRNYMIGEDVYEGCNNPSMWAHYGENGEGACIAIDRKKFEAQNAEVLQEYFHRFDDVEYRASNTVNPDQLEHSDYAEDFIQKNCQHLFFRKHITWSNEYEYRLFLMNYKGKLHIDGCIKFIVLGNKFIENRNQIIRLFRDHIANTLPDCTPKFSTKSFAMYYYSMSAYQICNAEYKIQEHLLQEIKSLQSIKNYIDWDDRAEDYCIEL